jgi:ABC-type transporter MlaC component
MEFIEGRWLVFDLQIDGASLIINNRSIFKREIDTSGIEGLIITLRQKNAEALVADQSPLR